jgi:AAA family ATP:ADP antiporter
LMFFLRNLFLNFRTSFTFDAFKGGFLFFLVLSSWYILRPVRNEMAVSNVNELPYLLGAGALAMLLLNPLYSWIASRTNLKKIVFYCYSFFITNLIFFIFSWRVFDLSNSIWLERVFYVWSNVFSFFIVSIFWVVIINLFRDLKTRNFYGVIMAGGSLGAFFGSSITKQLSGSFNEFGLEFFSIFSAIFLFLAMLFAIQMINKSKPMNKLQLKNVGGGSLDAIKNSIERSEIRNISLYVWIWTGLMTVQWITAANIVESWSQDPQERIEFFSLIEQIISPLTFIFQVFLTNIIIQRIGITIVAIVQIFLRVFEYAINKPTREIIFSSLKKDDRYKSSVFIDTFISRFGDLTGSSIVAIGKLTTVAANMFPLFTIPIAAYISLLGIKISKQTKIKDL